ncbi:hypothetical protein [Pseudoalteromonas tetraodonis]|uniref:hypothetical protein n=1 Tax=Pseudoalteromonas tetraodonis TaxID=43659 RepID=UPI003EB6B45F
MSKLKFSYKKIKHSAALVKSSGAEGIIKPALQNPHQTLHVDETGINIGGKR